MPLISIVIPVYNGEAFVADAIDSVLAQKGAAFELIVIDDGSTDATPAILARYGRAIAVHRQPNRGEGAARNAALSYLRGDLVLFLDADDLLPAGYLDRFAAAAREAPEIEVFHCGWHTVTFDGKPVYAVEEPRPIDVDPFTKCHTRARRISTRSWSAGRRSRAWAASTRRCWCRRTGIFACAWRPVARAFAA